MNIGRWIRALAAAAASLGLVSCGGGGGGGIGGTGGTVGTMRISMTDAPACGYDHVWITVEGVRVHQSGGANDGEDGWTEVLVDPHTGGRRIDLLSLRNGVQTELGTATLPAGTYRQMRLVLAGNTGSTLANAVVLTGEQDERALDTPSAQQSGIKLNMNVTVPEGQEAHVLLDFDACKSIVKAGNSGKYLLKPVIEVSTLLADAGLRVQGVVEADLANPATIVSLQSSGPDGPMVAKATTPNGDGSFTLSPVPAGTYSLVITSPTHPTAVMTGVPVVGGMPTVVSNGIVRLDPPATAIAPRDVPGTLSPPDGTVRALQRFQDGLAVEVQWAPVDPTTGEFSFALPAAASLRTAYVANLAAMSSFAWTSDATTPQQYTIEATAADGVGRKSSPTVDVLAPTLPALDFVFP